MRILFLSDNFPPEWNAPASRLYEHASCWVAAGHEVTVITCAPNFPDGKLFPGYCNRWHAIEVMDGIRVVRVKTYLTANAGFLKRTLDYVSFMAMGGLAAFFQPRPDVIVTTSPQFLCAMASWMVTRLRRLPWVFELRDIWPASIVAVGAMKKSRAIRLLERIELRMYRDADAVVSVTQSYKTDLARRGIDPAKIDVVLNGVDLLRYRPMPKDEALLDQFDLRGKVVAGYLGTHGMAHALDKVADAATILRDRSDIVFLFAGAGAKLAELGDVRDLQMRRANEYRLHAASCNSVPTFARVHGQRGHQIGAHHAHACGHGPAGHRQRARPSEGATSARLSHPRFKSRVHRASGAFCARSVKASYLDRCPRPPRPRSCSCVTAWRAIGKRRRDRFGIRC